MQNTKYTSFSVVLPSSSPIVTIVNNQATCLSTDVAQFFGKLHQHVIRDIENLLSKLPSERLTNFGQTFATRANPKNPQVQTLNSYFFDVAME